MFLRLGLDDEYMSYHILCVDPDRVKEVWPRCKLFIEKAFTRLPLSDFAVLEEDILEKQALLWLVCDDRSIRMAIVTRLYKNHCEISACGGSHLKESIHLLARIEQYARDEGVKSIRITGRKGWGRILPDYKQRAVILEKEL